MTPDDSEHELVMPFVAVQSSGGPFDDKAYTAGAQMGSIDAVLAMLTGHKIGTSSLSLYVMPENVAQLDLVAMRHGFTMSTESVTVDGIDDEWTLATFSNEPADDAREDDPS